MKARFVPYRPKDSADVQRAGGLLVVHAVKTAREMTKGPDGYARALVTQAQAFELAALTLRAEHERLTAELDRLALTKAGVP